MYQDSLTYLGSEFVNDTDELVRINANYRFIKTMAKALKVPKFFSFSVRYIKKYQYFKFAPITVSGYLAGM